VISDIPGYEEPSLSSSEDSFGAISQLWGKSEVEAPLTTMEDESSQSFDSISQLWGEDLSEDKPRSKKSKSRKDKAGTQRVSKDEGRSKTRGVKEETEKLVGDGSELRLSQMLANEEWVESTAGDELKDRAESMTFDSYVEQVKQILKAEKEEMLETEAILRAPPAADNVDVPEKDKSSLLRAVNATDGEDDLTVLEMDEPEDALLEDVGPVDEVNGDTDADLLGTRPVRSVLDEEVNGDSERFELPDDTQSSTETDG
jgi:hypothetical protein